MPDKNVCECDCALKTAVKITTWINIVVGVIFAAYFGAETKKSMDFENNMGTIHGGQRLRDQNMGTSALAVLFVAAEICLLVTLHRARRKAMFLSATAALGAMSGMIGCSVYHATEIHLKFQDYIYVTVAYLPFFLGFTYIVLRLYEEMATSRDD